MKTTLDDPEVNFETRKGHKEWYEKNLRPNSKKVIQFFLDKEDKPKMQQ